MRRARTTAVAAALTGLLAGCSGGAAEGSEDAAPTVQVRSGAQDVTVQPTQYCLDGAGERYSSTPPIIEVTPDSTIALTVTDAVAEQGWSVQVYDDQLAELIGEVDVEDDTTTFTDINSSDVVPPAFYLVVVEDSDDDACGGLSGAWPIGFIRSGDDTVPDDTAAPTSSG